MQILHTLTFFRNLERSRVIVQNFEFANLAVWMTAVGVEGVQCQNFVVSASFVNLSFVHRLREFGFVVVGIDDADFDGDTRKRE